MGRRKRFEGSSSGSGPIFIKQHQTKVSGRPCSYIVYRQEHSQKAQLRHGCPFVWRPIAKIRQSPPRDEASFQTWLWNLVKKYGAGVYRIVRTQAEGERAGFHPVFYGYIDETYLEVQRGYADYKSHPNLPPSRQAFFKIPKARRQILASNQG